VLKLSDFRFAAIAAAMLLFAPAGAEATVYNYDFTSTDGLLNAEGAFTVTGDEITGVTGALSGLVTQTINAIAPSTAPPTSPIAAPTGPPTAMPNSMPLMAPLIAPPTPPLPW